MAHILVTDDDACVREMLRLVLCAEGYDVRTAADDAVGVASTEKALPSLVILDVMRTGRVSAQKDYRPAIALPPDGESDG